MSWTDERVELLKKLWMDGHSASQIAGELGEGVTRNAVIGKVHRLKLSQRAKPAASTARVRPAPRPVAPRRPSLGGGGGGASSLGARSAPIAQRRPMTTQSIGATALAASVDMEMEMYVAPAPAAELFIPESERLTLLQLSEKTCKWPIGDPLTTDFYFCGGHADEGRPYCEFHSRRAYHTIDKKAKKH